MSASTRRAPCFSFARTLGEPKTEHAPTSDALCRRKARAIAIPWFAPPASAPCAQRPTARFTFRPGPPPRALRKEDRHVRPRTPSVVKDSACSQPVGTQAPEPERKCVRPHPRLRTRIEQRSRPVNRVQLRICSRTGFASISLRAPRQYAGVPGFLRARPRASRLALQLPERRDHDASNRRLPPEPDCEHSRLVCSRLVFGGFRLLLAPWSGVHGRPRDRSRRGAPPGLGPIDAARPGDIAFHDATTASVNRFNRRGAFSAPSDEGDCTSDTSVVSRGASGSRDARAAAASGETKIASPARTVK